MTLGVARKMAYDIGIPRNKRFYRETTDSYRFRNIARRHFTNLRVKEINEFVSIVVGNVKKDGSDDVSANDEYKVDEF
jgi:hypothetical protein